MKLSVTKHPVNDGVVRLAVKGELEGSTVDVLTAAVEQAIAVDHVAELVLDLHGVTLLDAAGMAALSAAADTAADDGVTVVTIGPHDRAHRALALSDILGALTAPTEGRR